MVLCGNGCFKPSKSNNAITMNHPERDFYNYLRPKFLGHVQRIENTVGSGMPDVNFCSFGIETWVELKVAIQPKGEVWLRKEQFAWSMRRASCLGRVFVVALNQDMVWVWKYPDVQVEAVGTSEKYVRITNAPFAQVPKSLCGKQLDTILFT